MKKEFACNGTVVSSADSSDEDSPAPNKATDFGKVLQFQGDQRVKVKDFLVASGVVTDKEAKNLIVMYVLVLWVVGAVLMTMQSRLLSRDPSNVDSLVPLFPRALLHLHARGNDQSDGDYECWVVVRESSIYVSSSDELFTAFHAGLPV